MKSRRLRAFTLVEMLVGMAVLLLFLTLLTSVFGDAARTWVAAREKMDNFAKGRALVNAIARDLANSVLRQDLPAFPTAGGALAFYTRQFGQETDTATQRPLTFVSYTLEGGDIVRSDLPYGFFDTPPAWQTVAAGSEPEGQRIRRVLCREVVAFRHRFLQADGSVETVYRDALQDNPTRAVSVSLVILSDKTARLLRETGQDRQLRTELAAIDASAPSAKAAWDEWLASGELASGYPPSVRQGIRTYERITPLHSGPPIFRQTSL